MNDRNIGGRVLSPASYAAMTTPRGAAAPPGPGFGFGLHVNPSTWGMSAITHSGALIGYAAQNAWFPAESLSVTILYNSLKGSPNPFPANFLLEIARAVSAPALPPSGSSPPKQQPVSGPPRAPSG